MNVLLSVWIVPVTMYIPGPMSSVAWLPTLMLAYQPAVALNVSFALTLMVAVQGEGTVGGLIWPSSGSGGTTEFSVVPGGHVGPVHVPARLIAAALTVAAAPTKRFPPLATPQAGKFSWLLPPPMLPTCMAVPPLQLLFGHVTRRLGFALVPGTDGTVGVRCFQPRIVPKNVFVSSPRITST